LASFKSFGTELASFKSFGKLNWQVLKVLSEVPSFYFGWKPPFACKTFFAKALAKISML